MENYTQQPSLFVIVLNFNGKDTLNNCLASLYQSDYPNMEIVVVDNNSEDGSFEQAKSFFSRAHFIKNPTNLGFAKGNNVGIRFALEKFAEYVLILNNDTVIEKTTLSFLIQTMKRNPGIGIASPLIFSINDKVWFAGGKLSWLRMKALHLQNMLSASPYATEYISGCSMLVRKDVFKKIGLFDERFFLYYEDADFSLRAKKAGFDLCIVPEAKLQHLEQSTMVNHKKFYWLVFSGLLFFYLHSGFLKKMWFFFYLQLRKTKNRFDLFFKKNDAAFLVRKAYVDFKKINSDL
ncbi:MAG TPA: glycosyltransferase family 2 protein [Candidatus Moranbacteria bacterium]|nr:glycosyltransferase family 2 protein [Candidatus Moranbacteria bacterium]